MTEHEFFKLLADVDEDLVIDAKAPADLYNDPFSDLPQKIKPVRRSSWKPLAAAAACLAVIMVGLTVVLNIRGRQSEPPLESNTWSNKVITLAAAAKGYPAAAAYQYKGDFSELKIAFTGAGDFLIWENDKKPSFAWADLIVVGTFVDDAYQTFDPENKSMYHLTYRDYSCNKLRIDRVIKGGAEVGDEIIVCDSYGVADGMLYHEGLTPMIKGDTWCYVLQRDYGKGENCYTASIFSRFPVPGSVQPEFPYLKNTCGLAENSNYDSYVHDYYNKYYEYAERMLNGDPEILKTFRIEYNGKIYYRECSGEAGGVKVTIGMPRTEIRAGDDVEVLAVIENTTDKPAGLRMGSTDPEINILITQDSGILHKKVLNDNGYGTVGYDDVMTSLIIPPGETIYQLMRFSTVEQSYRPEDTVIPDYVRLGRYYGAANIKVLSDPNDTMSSCEEIYFSFDVNITDSRSDEEFTMNEFPGVSFKCGRTELTANVGGRETALFSDVPIKELYLIDLNGDGKRELCSSVSYGSGSTDDRVMVFDYANGKLYELSDRMTCDYHIEVYRSPSGEWYANVARYDYICGRNISSEPLTLDIMTEVDSITTDEHIIISAMKLAGSELEYQNCEFRLPEFPGVEFVCKNKRIYADGYPTGYMDIARDFTALYIADLNGDGKREILAECADSVLERTWVYIFDYANNRKYDIGLNSYDNYTLDYDDDGVYLITNGRREEEKLMIAAPGLEIIRDDNNHLKRFSIPEVPGSPVFIVDNENKCIQLKHEDGKTETLMNFGDNLNKIYLCDISGDGRREIAVEGTSAGKTYIRVYDAAMSRLYEYDMAESATLECGEDYLAAAIRRPDGSVLFSRTLTLDIMRLKINSGKNKYFSIPEVNVIYDENVHTNRFVCPFNDDLECVIEGGDIAVYQNGVKIRDLFGSDDVKKVYLYDTECDMEEEIYAVVRRKGESKYVICAAYSDEDGYLRITATESVNVGSDMDMIVSEIRTLLYKDTALG
ncbi:MAG: hypothetical protein K2N56_01335 [Oscillospiraceae bacterium]|nr:hypothetical protein [Oscillospiraceae bacterium]